MRLDFCGPAQEELKTEKHTWFGTVLERGELCLAFHFIMQEDGKQRINKPGKLLRQQRESDCEFLSSQGVVEVLRWRQVGRGSRSHWRGFRAAAFKTSTVQRLEAGTYYTSNQSTAPYDWVRWATSNCGNCLWTISPSLAAGISQNPLG